MVLFGVNPYVKYLQGTTVAEAQVTTECCGVAYWPQPVLLTFRGLWTCS